MHRWPSAGSISLALCGWAVGGCGAAPVEAPAPAPAPAASAATAKAPSLSPRDGEWRYVVTPSDDLRTLRIEASFPAGPPRKLSVDDGAGPYVQGVERWTGKAWTPLEERRGHRWAGCGPGPCRVRYRFALREASREVGDEAVAARWGQTVLSPPSAWLLQPRPAPDTPYRFEVKSDAVEFVTGVWRASKGRHGSTSGDLWRAPYSAFGRFHRTRLEVGGGEVEVAISQAGPKVPEAEAVAFVKTAAETVAAYYGRFPLPRVLTLVVPLPGGRLHGRQIGGGGASILFGMGEHVTAKRLRHEWVGVHEMIHLAVPGMPRRHLWLTEGLATYVEPIARAQLGALDDLEVWRGMVAGMHHGLPLPDDTGLDGSRSWGRIYWGGALFALRADIGIRRATGGKKTLQHALRAVVEAGGHNGGSWPIGRFFRVADEATGTRVMRDLYASTGDRFGWVDLERLWRDLGVVGRGKTLHFDDTAPLASVRKAITQRPPSLAPTISPRSSGSSSGRTYPRPGGTPPPARGSGGS